MTFFPVVEGQAGSGTVCLSRNINLSGSGGACLFASRAAYDGEGDGPHFACPIVSCLSLLCVNAMLTMLEIPPTPQVVRDALPTCR